MYRHEKKYKSFFGISFVRSTDSFALYSDVVVWSYLTIKCFFAGVKINRLATDSYIETENVLHVCIQSADHDFPAFSARRHYPSVIVRRWFRCQM